MTQQTGKKENHIQTVLLSLITAAIIGCFSFLWNLNGTVAKMQEQNFNRTQRIDDVQQGVNELRLDMKDTKKSVQDVSERLVRVEANQNK